MTDMYTKAVNTGLGKTVAAKLGLPRPALLRRHQPGATLTVGPVLLVADAASATTATAVGGVLRGWGLDVTDRFEGSVPDRGPEPTNGHPTHESVAAAEGETRWGAIVLVVSEVARPADASAAVLALPKALKRLAPHGRVVTVSRAAAPGDAPELAAARRGFDGFLRSLAKELRAGATGNGIVLADGIPADHPSARAALRFFLSAKSAFVDGQLLTVGSADAGHVESAQAWERPLEGKVAVVTGAARGIGAAIAKTLARDGATVVCVDVPAAGEGLARTANAVRGTALQLDVTAPDAGERIIEHARTRHGRLDVVVHNAGILRDKLLANMDPARWDSVVAVNVEAQLRINEALLAAAARGDVDGLRIVSLASTSGIAGNRGQTNYGFTKAGVIGHTEATAALLAEHGGTANAVAPGFIETDMTRHIPFVPRQVARRVNSLQQGGQPVDVAEAVAFLASPLAAGVTGQTLRVCGQNMVGR
ncbi:short-chain dehydrogenase/reductase SDR [Xylanimonas cellulosilytica DSM 15894]|uniref:Short-chain dehydrogenase/reductase SDR n=1 Tax=Xylanimonas cellulosilytica (strain DSM 15894 / JCM 12276 / CECT 5975 / KCTC 9989 / LMG 20990 / NBRC 107835 / XIL07) TaxID=446471 RepID=D1BZY7_XYLCX|nr:3-oxoacyl-ACP reductase [Xylanimonas cellulosilytica]ACZ32115.1 short-chain dehydrogenase/reductase SDR [Xylanimonas cellulosilytica DSM 15894]